MTKELNPCPFCGEDHIELVEDDQKFIVTCILCGASTDWSMSKNFIIDRWNTRADHIPQVGKKGWISVDNQLPDESDRYWCYVRELNDLGFSHYQWNIYWNEHTGSWVTQNGSQVTHWRPLAEPPL